MKTEKVQLAELKHPEKNTRKHPTKQIEEMKRSVDMFGQIRPLIVDGDTNTVLAGNGLLMAIREMEWKEADALVVKNLTDAEKNKLMIADNRIYALGLDDHDNIFDLLGKLGDDLDVPGYDDELLKDLMSDDDELEEELESYGKIEPESVEEINNARERVEHRIENTHYEEKEEDTLPVEVRYAVDDEEDDSPQSENREAPTLKSKSVVCPNCGGTGWL